MATYQISAPSAFDFQNPASWKMWIKRFERFRLASKLNAEDEENQVNSLVYTMGDKAEEIFLSFGLSAADAKKYDAVKGKFEDHFIVKYNIIYERAKFNRRVQTSSESVDQFITALYTLADTCEYSTLRDELIRDRLVVGLKDERLSQKLQLQSKLTLESATTQARQHEQVKTQQGEIRTSSATSGGNVDALYRKSYKKPYTPKKESKPSDYNVEKKPSDSGDKCKWCGYESHQRNKCPARNAKCGSCQTMGHYSSVCFRRKQHLHELHEGSDEDPTYDPTYPMFMGCIHSDDSPVCLDSITAPAPIIASLGIDNYEQKVQFKIDTGADVTAIPLSLLDKIGHRDLEPPGKQLLGCGNNPLEVLGRFNTTLSCDKKSVREDIYVVNNLHMPLLGRPAISKLNLVSVNMDSVRSLDDVKEQYPKLLRPLGDMMEPYDAVLADDAVPYSLTVPRRIAVPLLPKVKSELERMVKLGVIKPMTEPTDWCAGIVVVPKPRNDDIRICVDLTQLNKSIKRERLQLPSEAETLAQLTGSTIFSKLDITCSYWQIPLTPRTQLLTTFITPFGRFCFLRLPFGISSATEHFERRMQKICSCIPGVVCRADDALVCDQGKGQEAHDDSLNTVLQRLNDAGATLNDKCEFSKPSVTFWGSIISKDGVKPMLERVQAIADMQAPTNITELRRFLGMANQLGKYTKDLAELSTPLRDLLGKESAWLWGPSQEEAFCAVKRVLCSPEVLALYDAELETIISADASSHGLGAAILQKQRDGSVRPVAYASRSLSPTEQRYAQIEKEALAATWACEKFHEYLIGLEKFTLQSDHKPLIPLLGDNKPLTDLPPRIQRFRMRLMRFRYSIIHVPGKDLWTADALSRAPSSPPVLSDTQLEEDANIYLCSVLDSLPASAEKLDQIRIMQDQDEICRELVQYCLKGWPAQLPVALKPYWQYRGHLTVISGLLLMDSRIVIPTSLRVEMLSKLHDGHQGIARSRALAKQSMWWPGLSKQIEDLVNNCKVCCREQRPKTEPLTPTPLPDRPWQRVGTDLFEHSTGKYLTVVDYFSRYVEVALLTKTDSASTITKLKSIFARHGVPETVISDNGPQYASAKFAEFARDYGFTHITSSPGFPQSNGAAERSVQTLKAMLRKSEDPYKALMCYRSTPLHNGYSPAELLFGRRLRTHLPITPDNLAPKWPNLAHVRQLESQYRDKAKLSFDSRHRAQELPPLEPGADVWVRDMQRPGQVVGHHPTPRSYLVASEGTTLRRNRADLQREPPTVGTVPAGEPELNNQPDIQPSLGHPLDTLPPKNVLSPEKPPPETIPLRRSQRPHKPNTMFKDFVVET